MKIDFRIIFCFVLKTKEEMGCMLGCNKDYDDDDMYIREDRYGHHHHHQRAHRRVGHYDNYCLLCRCQQYDRRHPTSNHCYCGHRPNEHKRY